MVVSSTTSVYSDIRLTPTGFLNLPAQILPPADLSVTYKRYILITGGTWPYSFKIVAGSLPVGLTLNDATGSISGIPTSSGISSVIIGVTDSVGGYAEGSFSISVAIPVTITAVSPLSSGTVGTASMGSITATGGRAPYTFLKSTGTLPPGLTLSTAGVLSGAPTTAGAFTFTVTATDLDGRTVKKEFKLTVFSQLVITTTRLANAFTGTPYSQSLVGSGGEGAYTWDIVSGALPGKISLDSSTGAITGSATAESANSIMVRLRDAGGRSATRSYTFNVVAPLQITVTTLPSARVNIGYSQKIQTSGGVSPFTFSYQGQLPVGLKLDTATGIISGSPTTQGSVNFGITVSDSTWPSAQSAVRSFGIRTVVDVLLTTHIAGIGGGTVSAVSSGIFCDSGTCISNVGQWSTVTLVARPLTTSTFTGWSGECTGVGECLLTMDSAKSVTATFAIASRLSVSLDGAGTGSIHSDPVGLACDKGLCTSKFPTGAAVILLQTPGRGSLFQNWSGACAGSGGCTMTLDGDRSVKATFSSPLPARIGGAFYLSPQVAYEAANPKEVIMLKEGDPTGGLIADKEKRVTIRGGYRPDYSVNDGDTVIQGPVILKSGTVLFDKVGIR